MGLSTLSEGSCVTLPGRTLHALSVYSRPLARRTVHLQLCADCLDKLWLFFQLSVKIHCFLLLRDFVDFNSAMAVLAVHQHCV